MEENIIEKLMKLCDYEKLDKHNVLLSYQNEGICFINKNGQDVEYPVLGVAIDEGVWYVKITNNPDQWVSIKDIYIVEEQEDYYVTRILFVTKNFKWEKAIY